MQSSPSDLIVHQIRNHWLNREAGSMVFLVLPNSRLKQQKSSLMDCLTQVLLRKTPPPRYELMLCRQLVSRLGTTNGHSENLFLSVKPITPDPLHSMTDSSRQSYPTNSSQCSPKGKTVPSASDLLIITDTFLPWAARE